ncbi:MAG: hypothetical protein KF758_17900 [Anaerolineales bacterium]|nr:hypothetical protein [Anaerolineales bacterium]MBX3038789.1 hypothetical protein [Anaerolineales bacterium]
MKTKILLTMLISTLTACAPTTITISTNTPLQSSTFTPLPSITPSPLPTQPPIHVITPDAIQVERWREYETALAKSVLSYLPPEEVLCEWDILGRYGNDVYVWAVCRGKDGGGSVPAVIHLETDGAVQSVERAKNWSRDIPRLFPSDVREKFAHYQGGRAREMQQHIEWRRTHPEEPPLIILSLTPTP